jgi:GT2 family glycosyltransferase
MPEGHILLSIIIVNWNTWEHLKKALQSIQESNTNFLIEVIVVDNGSTDGSIEMLHQQFPDVHCIANSNNAGYAAANNQGVNLSSGDFILLMNPDVQLSTNSLQRSMDIFQGLQQSAAMGIKLLSADGSTQRSVRGFPTPLSVFFEAMGLSKIFPDSKWISRYRMTWFKYDELKEVDQPMGAFLLISRAAWTDIGELDERFPIFFNDVDWCLRAKNKGWKIWFSPEPQVIHYGGASTGLVWDKMAWESRESLLAFYRKHFPSLVFAPLFWIVSALSWIHAAISYSRRSRLSHKTRGNGSL